MSAAHTTAIGTDGRAFVLPFRAVRTNPGRAADQPPEGHLLTPFGYRPAARVHKVAVGTRLRASATSVEVLDIETEDVLETHPVGKPGEFAAASSNGGWIAYAGWTNNAGTPITSFKTTWKVPPVPPNTGKQTIFLFNGMEDDTYILQPVLQWGTSAAGAGDFWQVASWFVASDTSGGQSFYSDLVRVNPGDSITGTMTLDSVDAGGFHYICGFDTFANTKRIWTNPNELTWCNEALEAYSIASCDQYPPGSIAMTNIQLSTANGVPAVQWSPVENVRDCSQAATLVADGGNGGEIDFAFGTG